MKILFVTHFLPYPPNDGGRIGYYNPLKYLSRRHEIVLASIAGPAEVAHVEALRPFCSHIIDFSLSGAGLPWRAARGAVASPPGTASKYYCRAFGALLHDAVQRFHPDIVELQHLNTAAYLPYCSGPVAILREHNVEHKVWERYATHAAAGPQSWLLRALAARVRRYEAAMATRFSRCITVSEADERSLQSIAPRARVLTIPSGVDGEYFIPSPSVGEDPCSMVLSGSFVWKPKHHGLKCLITEVFPRIRAAVPEARLTIVGKGVPPALKSLAESHGVVVTGTVPDVRPFVQRAALVLNYLEAGGGIALKVLEAFAMRKAVLSNSLGVEGIRVRAGEHCFVADGPEAFAAAAASLLRDPERRARIASAGYDLARSEYAWDRLADRFDCVYREALFENGKRS